MATISLGNSLSLREFALSVATVGKDVTVIGQGEPGIGKSSVLRTLKDIMPEYETAYIDCTLLDLSDFALPFTVEENGVRVTRFAPNARFKLHTNKPVIVMLDEIGKAMKAVKNVLLTLMLEQRIGDMTLPKGSIVFGTSNNASDGVGDTMLAHAGNRVCVVRMAKPTPTEWLEWASANGVSRVVRAWVAMFPRALASYIDGNQDDNPYIFKPNMSSLSFVSPRSLAKCDVIVRNRDVLGENATMCALAGTIGHSAAGDMSAFLSLEKSLADVKDIIKKPDSIEVPTDISAQLMIMFQAVDTLESQDDLSKFMVFVKRIASSEVQAVFFTMMVRSPKGIKLARNNAEIAEWARNNHELF